MKYTDFSDDEAENQKAEMIHLSSQGQAVVDIEFKCRSAKNKTSLFDISVSVFTHCTVLPLNQKTTLNFSKVSFL